MPDERRESTAQGIAPAPESAIGRDADERRREQVIRAPVQSRPDTAMGGTSDGETAGDEAWTPTPEKENLSREPKAAGNEELRGRSGAGLNDRERARTRDGRTTGEWTQDPD